MLQIALGAGDCDLGPSHETPEPKTIGRDLFDKSIFPSGGMDCKFRAALQAREEVPYRYKVTDTLPLGRAIVE